MLITGTRSLRKCLFELVCDCYIHTTIEYLQLTGGKHCGANGRTHRVFHTNLKTMGVNTVGSGDQATAISFKFIPKFLKLNV